MDLRQRLRIDLTDEEYRHAYADEQLNLSIGTQIKVIREQQRMNQAELAQKIGTKQTGISRLESANYCGWSIAVLRRLARAFDLRLRVSFEEFGTLWKEVGDFNRQSLERIKFEDDPEFQGQPAMASTEALGAQRMIEFNEQVKALRAMGAPQTPTPIDSVSVYWRNAGNAVLRTGQLLSTGPIMRKPAGVEDRALGSQVQNEAAQ